MFAGDKYKSTYPSLSGVTILNILLEPLTTLTLIACSFISLLKGSIHQFYFLNIVSCKCTQIRDITNIKSFVSKGNGTCQMKSITWFLPTLLGKVIIKGAELASATVPWHWLFFWPRLEDML